MKKLVLTLTLFATPAFAQQMPALYADKLRAAEAARMPQDRAMLKCWQDAKWVVPKGYYEKCSAEARR